MERFKAQLFIGLGLLLLVMAVLEAFQTRRFIAESVVVPGRVVELSAGGSHPVIRFPISAGQTRLSPQGGWIFGYKVGDRVRMRYRVAAPQATATLDAFGTLWFSPIFLLVLGTGFMLGGYLNLPAGSKARRTR